VLAGRRGIASARASLPHAGGVTNPAGIHGHLDDPLFAVEGLDGI